MLPLLIILASLPGPPPLSDDRAVPQGTATKDPVTTGSTELGSDSFATVGEKPEEQMDATELNLSAGGILLTGNSRSLAVTGLGKFLLRRKIHQATAAVAGNYGQAALAARDDPATTDIDEAEIQRTAGNVQGQARYEVFFHERFSAFLMATARHDKFQGLDLRLNIDPGIAMYAIIEENHKLWFEVGYDFQVDVRDREALARAEMIVMEDLERVRLNHAARLFFGYTNNLSERVTFDTGLEYLQSVIIARWYRFNWVNALAVNITTRFSLGATFTLRYDSLPLPGIEKTDTVTAILLGVRLI